MTHPHPTSPLLVDQISRYLTHRMRLSDNTRSAYQSDLRLMVRTLAATLDPSMQSSDLDVVDAAADTLTVDDLTVENIEGAFLLINEGAFRAHGSGPRSRASVQRARACMVKFCDRLNDQLLIPRNPMSAIENVRIPRTLPKSLSQEQTVALIAAAGDEPPPTVRVRWPARDVALIKTALYTGARSSELTALDVGRIGDAEGGQFVHITGKGEHERRVPLPRPAARAVSDYLAERLTVGVPAPTSGRTTRPRMRRGVDDAAPPWQRIRGDEPLFVTTIGERMTRGYLYRLIDRIYQQAQMPPMTRGSGVATHALRHTYATRLQDNGASVLEIQRLLGHMSADTSARYVSLSTAGLHDLAESIKAGLEDSPADAN